MRMTLESATDEISLNGQVEIGRGYQVLTGITGMGFAPRQVQWVEGAGHGSIYRGTRTLARDLDLPLSILGLNRAHLQQLLSRLAVALRDKVTLRLYEDNGTSWYLECYMVGGGQYVHGVDTIGEREFQTVLTLRAGDPFWTRTEPIEYQLKAASNASLLPNLSKLELASDRVIGAFQMVNPGDASAFPIWTVQGPGQNFIATAPNGDRFRYTGTLLANHKLIVDTQRGTVELNGTNRYDLLDVGPKFWAVPPGTTYGNAALAEPGASTFISVAWRPRKHLVV